MVRFDSVIAKCETRTETERNWEWEWGVDFVRYIMLMTALLLIIARTCTKVSILVDVLFICLICAVLIIYRGCRLFSSSPFRFSTMSSKPLLFFRKLNYYLTSNVNVM